MAGAMADCGTRLSAGEFTTHVERARCEGVEARGSVEGLGMEYAFGDLVALMSEWRLRLARERDAGKLDAAAERARQKQFDDAFLREMDVRERLHNNGAPFIDFNACEIEGNGLRCTQADMRRIQKQIDASNAECDRKDDMGYFSTMESVLRCAAEGGFVLIYERNNFPHKELVRLFGKYMISLAKRWDEKSIPMSEFERHGDSMVEQFHSEIKRRDNLRAAGDLNWRHQDCRVEQDRLVCRNLTD